MRLIRLRLIRRILTRSDLVKSVSLKRSDLLKRIPRKQRLIILGALLLIVLPLVINSLLNIRRAKAEAPWATTLTNWGKRQRLTVVNNSGDSLANGTTIAVSVDTKRLFDLGKLKSNCSDIRVVYQPDSSTTTDLDRFISYPGGGSCSTSQASKVYFKIQADLGSTSETAAYYMYYANPQASAPSNSDNAFDIGSADALLVCPFDGTTTCAATETPSTATGAIRYSGAKSALRFDGSNDKVSYTWDEGTFSAGTIEMYVKLNQSFATGASADFGILSNNLSGANDGDINSIKFQNADGTLQLTPDVGSIFNSTKTTWNANQWYHLAFTWDGTNLKLYIDGALDKSASRTQGLLINASFTLGDDNNFQYLPGLLDEVRVSNVVRYSSNFTPSTAPFVRDEYTQLLYHFDENGDDPRQTGKAIDDACPDGTCNHGTITGAKYVGGLVGVDSTSPTTPGVNDRDAYASHEGIFIEEATTNKITNPSFEHATYGTSWTASGGTPTENTTIPFYKFGSKSYKLTLADTSDQRVTTSVTVTAVAHNLSAYLYRGTSGSVGETIAAAQATLWFNGAEVTPASYTDMGGGWWKLSYTATPTAGAQDFGVNIKEDSGTYYIDGVQLEAKAYATTYADGSLTSNAGGNDTYFWDDDCDGTLDAGEDQTADQNTQCSSRLSTNLRYTTSGGQLDAAQGSFGVWVKSVGRNIWSGTDEAYFVHVGSGGGGLKINIQNWSPVGLYIYARNTSTYIPVASLSSLTEGQWVNITATWDASNINLYVNNTITASIASSTTPTLGSLMTIGQEINFTRYSNSVISDARIFSTVLTSDERADLYYSGLVSHLDTVEVDKFDTSKGQDPIAIWHFDPSASSGQVAYDSSQYGNHLTVTGATFDTQSGNYPAQLTRTLKFDGTNDIASRSAGLSKNFNFGTDNFSISGWFRHPSTLTSQNTLISKYGSAGWKVYMNSSGYLCFGIDDDSSFDDDIICSNQNGNTTSYADSNWHHYEAVRDTSAIYLYIDGAKISEDLSLTSTLSLSSSSALFVGADSDNNEFWDGFLDEIVIYPYARSADQVKSDVLGSQLAASYGLLAADPLTEGLVGYWKMDETSDGTGAVTRVDSSGNGNSLTDNSPYAASTVGKFGNSTQFVSANSEYLSITDNASVSSGNIDFTITAWIYLDSLGTSKYIVAKWGGSNAQKEYQINVSGANLAQFSWATNASGGVGNVTANTFGTLSTSTWYFVAAYHNATTNTIGISINGGNFDTAAASGGNDGGGSLHIGATNTGSPVSFWNGRIDEVRVYSRALSAVEVQQLYDWAPGPVAYYKFDEGSGTTSVADSSGNGNTGTMNGSMTESDWVLGKFGNGLDLDGSDDYVEIGSSTKVDNSYAGTISAWIKPSGNTGYETIFGYGGGSTSGAGRFQMRLFGTSNRVILYQGSDGESPANLIYGGTSLSDNTWYYVTLSSDGSQYKIYVNGVEESLTISTGTNNGDWFADTSVIETDKSTLGRLWRDGAWLEPYRGIIDDLKIYNYARTPAQIIEDMNASHPAPGSPVGSPLLWWKFDQGTDNTCSGGANDVCNSGSSGTTLDATNNGATWSNSGKFGKALNFDTNTDDASASDQSFVDSLTGMTISLWLNPQTLTTSDDIIGKINTNQNSFRVVTDSVNSDEITVNIPTALSDLITSYSTSNLDLATGNWIHLTIVYDGTLSASSRVKVYKNAREVNGSVSGTLPAAMTSGSTSNLKLGEQDIAAGIALLSYYDEVKIYNFALTADQVKTEFNQGSATVFGSLGTTSSNSPSFSSSDSYCPPGQGTTCTAPVGEWMFDESSDGTGAVSRNDTSGNGNTLTDNNAVASSVGKHGNSAYFNATNTEFLSLTDNAFVSTGNIDFTICAWANLDTKTTNRMIVSKREGSNASKEYELHYLSSSDRFRFLLGDGTGATDGVVVSANNLGSPSTGTWYYVCGWHNAATDIIGISVNGSYIDTAATGAVAPIDTSSTFRVGSQVNTNYWDGKIDELRLYKYVRTSAQIAWDYNRGAPTAWYKFDECSGATAYNLAPAASGGAPGMNGTIYPGTGTPPQNTAVGTCGSGNNYEMWNDGTTGKRNASLGFDGNDDYADMGSNLDFSKMTSFTISTWIKTTTTGTNQQIINKWDSNNFGYLNSVFEIWLISTGKVRFYLSTNSGYDYIESSVISPDTWYQVTSWWDGTNIRLYINGNEVAYKALSGILGNTPDLIIGRISLNGTRYFNGQIDEVQIYNYALTATQIKTLYNAGAVRFGN